MRIVILFVLLGIHAFANGYVHSKITHTLQPGEIRNFYLPQQTGSVGIHFLQGQKGENSLTAGVSPRVTIQGDSLNSGNGTWAVYASDISDTNDWYPFLWNENTSVPMTVIFELRVHETIIATGDSVNLNLIPYAHQYVRIPAQPNYGLSYNFDIKCDDGTDDIDILTKSASDNTLVQQYDLAYRGLYENEDVLVLVRNRNNQQRSCTFSILSKATVVLNNGVNSFTISKNDTSNIGTRYNSTSPLNNVVNVQTNPSVPVKYRQISYLEEFYFSDGQTVQYYVFDTSELNDGDQLNVTVTPITTVPLTSGVKQTFQCVNSGDHHVFALVGNDKSGAALKLIQVEGVSQFLTGYVTDESSLDNVNMEFVNSVTFPVTQFADSNGVVWVIEVVCQSDNTDGSITASLPVLQTLSIGKNVLTIGAEDSYYILPEGPDQTTLGVCVNSSNANGWYAAHSYRGSEWGINNQMLTDVVYARDSPVVSPAWYFYFHPLEVDGTENVELILTTVPIVTLESGKTRQFAKPSDSYGYYAIIAKMESSNGLGHVMSYIHEYDTNSNDELEIFINSLQSKSPPPPPPLVKRSFVDSDVYISEYGNATYYFAVRTSNIDSPANLTATLAPVTTAVNGVIDFSRSAQAEQQDSYHTFLFPARKRYNSMFKFNLSSSTDFEHGGFENVGGYFDALGGYYVSYFMPDSMAAYIVTETDQSENATIHLESVATIGLCNSQYDCNGHGSCATVADQCTCTDDYSGDWCDVAPTPTPTDDNNNSGAGQMVATCQLLAVFVAVFLLA